MTFEGPPVRQAPDHRWYATTSFFSFQSRFDLYVVFSQINLE